MEAVKGGSWRHQTRLCQTCWKDWVVHMQSTAHLDMMALTICKLWVTKKTRWLLWGRLLTITVGIVMVLVISMRVYTALKSSIKVIFNQLTFCVFLGAHRGRSLNEGRKFCFVLVIFMICFESQKIWYKDFYNHWPDHSFKKGKTNSSSLKLISQHAKANLFWILGTWWCIMHKKDWEPYAQS